MALMVNNSTSPGPAPTKNTFATSHALTQISLRHKNVSFKRNREISIGYLFMLSGRLCTQKLIQNNIHFEFSQKSLFVKKRIFVFLLFRPAPILCH